MERHGKWGTVNRRLTASSTEKDYTCTTGNIGKSASYTEELRFWIQRKSYGLNNIGLLEIEFQTWQLSMYKSHWRNIKQQSCIPERIKDDKDSKGKPHGNSNEHIKKIVKTFCVPR